MVEDVSFFTKLAVDSGQQTLYHCLKFMQMEIFKQHDIICQKGDPGINFYIVISGRVQIYVSSNEQNIKKIKFINKEVEPAIYGMKCVSILGPGQSFGEIALIKEVPRMATVITECECEMATLSKHVFKQILATRQEEILEEKRQELKAAFQSINILGLYQLVYLTSSRSFGFREFVIRQGQSFQSDPVLFLVKSGEFRVSNKEISKNQGLFKKRECKLSKFYCILTKGELFGELEVFNKLDRLYTIQCVSEIGHVYAIKYQQLQQMLLFTNNKSTIENLKDQSILKYYRLVECERSMQVYQTAQSIDKKVNNNNKNNLHNQTNPKILDQGIKVNNNFQPNFNQKVNTEPDLQQKQKHEGKNRLMRLNSFQTNQLNQQQCDVQQVKKSILIRLSQKEQMISQNTIFLNSSIQEQQSIDISKADLRMNSIYDRHFSNDTMLLDKKSEQISIQNDVRKNQLILLNRPFKSSDQKNPDISLTSNSVPLIQIRNPQQEIQQQLKKIFSMKTRKQVRAQHYNNYSFIT